jgi:hypothetical protein
MNSAIRLKTPGRGSSSEPLTTSGWAAGVGASGSTALMQFLETVSDVPRQRTEILGRRCRSGDDQERPVDEVRRHPGADDLAQPTSDLVPDDRCPDRSADSVSDDMRAVTSTDGHRTAPCRTASPQRGTQIAPTGAHDSSSDRDAPAALCPTVGENRPAGLGPHTDPEPVLLVAPSVVGLVGPLHRSTSFAKSAARSRCGGNAGDRNRNMSDGSGTTTARCGNRRAILAPSATPHERDGRHVGVKSGQTVPKSGRTGTTTTSLLPTTGKV